jgi:hypothetical protein
VDIPDITTFSMQRMQRGALGVDPGPLFPVGVGVVIGCMREPLCRIILHDRTRRGLTDHTIGHNRPGQWISLTLLF